MDVITLWTYCSLLPFFGVSTLRPTLFLWPLTIPHPHMYPLLSGPPSVLYIYNEIQIRISRTVSTPRVTVWILLTLISWIMLIFTLSAHRQQTPHDMGVVMAVSVCCRVCLCVSMAVCVLEWLPCCQTDLHVKGRSNYITYANEKCMYARTHINTTDSLLLRSKRQHGLSSYWLTQDGTTTCLDSR